MCLSFFLDTVPQYLRPYVRLIISPALKATCLLQAVPHRTVSWQVSPTLLGTMASSRLIFSVETDATMRLKDRATNALLGTMVQGSFPKISSSMRMDFARLCRQLDARLWAFEGRTVSPWTFAMLIPAGLYFYLLHSSIHIK